MKNEKERQGKKTGSGPLLYTLIINLTALFLSFTLFKPYFEENDDTYLAMMAEGAFGKRDAHLIFINIVYGKLLKFFNGLMPSVRWYCVFLYILVFLSLCLMTRLLLEFRHGKLLSALLVFSCFFELYVSLQYTKVAAVCGIAGYIGVLFFTVKKKDLKYLISGGFLMIFSAMLRETSFYLASIFAFILFLSIFFAGFKKNPGLSFAKDFIFSHIKSFAGIFLVIGGLILFNSHVYNNDPEWKSYMDYNHIRTKLIDYRYDLLDTNTYGTVLKEKYGISENDALIYLTWQFSDDSVFSTDLMARILEDSSPRALDITLLKAFVWNFFNDILIMNPAFFGFFLSALALIIFSVKKIREAGDREVFPLYCECLLFAAGAFLAFFGIISYYQYSGRWSHRIVYAAILVMYVAFIYMLAELFEPETGKDISPVPVVLILSLCIVALADIKVLLSDRFDSESYKRTENDYMGYTAYTEENKDKLFVLDSFTFQNAYKYDVLLPCREGSLDNVIFISSWYINSPVTDGVLNRFGFSNPFQALAAADPKVVVADNLFIDEKITFLNEHYGGGYSHEETGEKCGYKEYLIRKVK